MRTLPLSVALASFLAFPATAAEPIVVLGIPIGGTLKVAPKVCPINTDKSKTPCWIDAPYRHTDGSLLGQLHLPDPASRPKWAAYATFEAQISRQATFEKLSVKAAGTGRLSEIQESITGRFGPPTAGPISSPSTYSATWSKPEIYVKLLCSINSFCVVEISSPSYRAEYERQMEKRRADDATRPKTL